MGLAASAQPVHTENTVAGIGWMLVTVFWFTSLDASAKYLLQVDPTFEVTWMLFFVALIFGAIAMAPIQAQPHQPQAVVAGSALRPACVTTGLFFVGIQTKPLATATSIMFLAPILVTLGRCRCWAKRSASAPDGRGGRLSRWPRHRAPGDRWRIGGFGLPAGGRLHDALYQVITRKVRVL